jgi:hypothetical protein
MECLNMGARSVYSMYIDPYVHLISHVHFMMCTSGILLHRRLVLCVNGMLVFIVTVHSCEETMLTNGQRNGVDSP